MGRFVLGELALIRYTDGLPSPGRHTVRPVARYVGIAVIEVEETGRQTDRQIRGCHLVVRRVACHVIQEVQECLQSLAMLVGQEEEDALDGVGSKLHWDVCGWNKTFRYKKYYRCIPKQKNHDTHVGRWR